MAAVIAACEVAHDHGTQTSAADVRDDWRDLNLDDEATVVEDGGGKIVASCDLINRHFSTIRAYGYVHPEQEGNGLGRFLIGWAEQWAWSHMDRADPDVQVVVRHYVISTNAAARSLFAAFEYEPVRHTFVMGINMDEPPPVPQWPEGITVQAYQPGVDERQIHEAVEDAFRDTWGQTPSSFDRFLAFSQGEGVKSDLWILARGGDEIAGVCLGTLNGEQGWIPTVGVRRAWRRKGLGLAVLQAGFSAYYRRGVTDVRLSVDGKSLTGATRLYERAGMQVRSEFVLYQKVLREGVEVGN